MYVSATSPRLSAGRSTPATRILSLLLPVRAPASPAQPPSGGGLGGARRAPLRLFKPVRDPAPGQVVRAQLHLDPVARKNPNEVHPHLARHVGQHLVPVVQLYPEHGVGQRLDHRSFDFDRVFFRHRVSMSGPFSVMATVCSKWAARLPSSVTAVHRSGRIRTSQPPIVTIGSMASTIPGFSRGPRPASPKLGIWGSSWSSRPMPCPTKARTTEKPCRSTCSWTACEISPRRRPGRHWSTPRSRLSWVTSSSCWTRGGTSPTARGNAQSA